MGALFDSKVLEINKKAKDEGIDGNFSGDKLTKGGLIIVDKGGENVLFEFKQESAGDHCPPEDVLKGICPFNSLKLTLMITALNISLDQLDSSAENAPECSDTCAL